jgi:glutamate racemase
LDSRPIGVFDSGIGGLTVVKEIMKILPNESIVYFGDTARVPYGNKSHDTVTKFALQDTRFLVSKGVKAIVIACNTASAFSLDDVQESFNMPIIGVINPGARAAIKSTRSGRIGIIGTEGTIGSRAYEKEIRKLKNDVTIFGYPCPLFVPLVEEGWVDGKIAHMVAEEYLSVLKEVEIDTLVMGCTHYPLLKKVVGDVMGPDVNLINPAEETALELKEILYKNNLENSDKAVAEYMYYVSDNPEKFARVGNNFLNKEITNICKIDIEKY